MIYVERVKEGKIKIEYSGTVNEVLAEIMMLLDKLTKKHDIPKEVFSNMVDGLYMTEAERFKVIEKHMPMVFVEAIKGDKDAEKMFAQYMELKSRGEL